MNNTDSLMLFFKEACRAPLALKLISSERALKKKKKGTKQTHLLLSGKTRARRAHAPWGRTTWPRRPHSDPHVSGCPWGWLAS